MTFKDLQVLQDSFGNLNDTLLRNRMMKQEQARYQQEQQRLGQQATAQANYRNQTESERERHDTADEDLRRRMLDIDQQKADTAAKGEASKGFKMSWKSGGQTVEITDPTKLPDMIKQFPVDSDSAGKTSTITMEGFTPDGHPVKQSISMGKGSHQNQDAVQWGAQQVGSFYQKFNGQKPPPASANKQTVRQVLNPAHVSNGVVDTNTPPFLQLTNTTTAMPPSTGDSTDSGGDAAPKIRKYNPDTGLIE